MPLRLLIQTLASIFFTSIASYTFESSSMHGYQTMVKNRIKDSTATVATATVPAIATAIAETSNGATPSVAIEMSHADLFATYNNNPKLQRIAISFMRAFHKHESDVGRVRERDATTGVTVDVNKAGRNTRNGWKDGASGSLNSGKGRSDKQEVTMKNHRSLELLGEKLGFVIA